MPPPLRPPGHLHPRLRRDRRPLGTPPDPGVSFRPLLGHDFRVGWGAGNGEIPFESSVDES